MFIFLFWVLAFLAVALHFLLFTAIWHGKISAMFCSFLFFPFIYGFICASLSFTHNIYLFGSIAYLVIVFGTLVANRREKHLAQKELEDHMDYTNNIHSTGLRVKPF